MRRSSAWVFAGIGLVFVATAYLQLMQCLTELEIQLATITLSSTKTKDDVHFAIAIRTFLVVVATIGAGLLMAVFPITLRRWFPKLALTVWLTVVVCLAIWMIILTIQTSMPLGVRLMLLFQYAALACGYAVGHWIGNKRKQAASDNGNPTSR